MPVAKPDPGANVIRNLNRKSQKRSAPTPSAKARDRPSLRDLPAVVVRLRGKSDPVELVNLPMRDNGADMVLHIIAEHPDACLMTSDLEYVRVADIVRVDCPERGEILIKALRHASGAGSAFRPLQVILGVRNQETVGIANIPDTPEGRKLFLEILREFRSTVDGAPSGYTFLTTDYGYIPVWEIAQDNKA